MSSEVTFTLGRLAFVPALDRLDLLAPPVAAAVVSWSVDHPAIAVSAVRVAEIDPDLADTAALCAAYDIPMQISANCVVVSARRGGVTRLAACVVLATTRADVNNLVRRHLDARKASFAPMDLATGEAAMEYGGITPVGLPVDWPVLVDARVAASPLVIIGSGTRTAKLCLPGAALADLAGAVVLEGLGIGD